MRRSARVIKDGFTLLEVMVALGVLAIGLSAAFGLLIAAASAGRRAEHQVNAALIAESIFSDLEGYPMSPAEFALLPLAGGDLAGDPPSAEGSSGDSGDTALSGEGGGGETRSLVRGFSFLQWLERRSSDEDEGEGAQYGDYTLTVSLTPVEGPQVNDPWAYQVDVEVRWSEKGRRQSSVFQTVLLLQPSHLNPPPPLPPSGSARAP